MEERGWLEPLIRDVRLEFAGHTLGYHELIAFRDKMKLFEQYPAGRKELDDIEEKIKEVEETYAEYEKQDISAMPDMDVRQAVNFLKLHKEYKGASRLSEKYEAVLAERTKKEQDLQNAKARKKLLIGLTVSAIVIIAIIIAVRVIDAKQKKELQAAYDAYTEALAQNDYAAAYEQAVKYEDKFKDSYDPELDLNQLRADYLIYIMENSPTGEAYDQMWAAYEAITQEKYKPGDLTDYTNDWISKGKDPIWPWIYVVLQSKEKTLSDEELAPIFEYALNFPLGLLQEGPAEIAAYHISYEENALEQYLFSRIPVDLDTALYLLDQLDQLDQAYEMDTPATGYFRFNILIKPDQFSPGAATQLTRESIEVKDSEEESETEDPMRFPDKLLPIAIEEDVIWNSSYSEGVMLNMNMLGFGNDAVGPPAMEKDIRQNAEDDKNYRVYLLVDAYMNLDENIRPASAAEVAGWLAQESIYVNTGAVKEETYTSYRNSQKTSLSTSNVLTDTKYRPYFTECDMVVLYTRDSQYHNTVLDLSVHDPEVKGKDVKNMHSSQFGYDMMVGKSDSDALKAAYQQVLDNLFIYELMLSLGEE